MENGGQLIFVSGGVRSGKSSFAEQTAVNYATTVNGNLHYIASGLAFDSEMNERIKRHQMEREDGNFKWTTWEEPTDLSRLPSFRANDIVLFDCLTNQLNNLLFQSEDRLMDYSYHREIMTSILQGIHSIQENCHTLIVVSNEILNESINSSDLVLVYAKLLGKLNQQIVALSKEAYVVESGIPVCMKQEVHYGAFRNRRSM